MRLVTWNCARGPYETKIELIGPLRADVAVIQECPRPPLESDQCLWFGDNPRQEIAVLAAGAYRLHRMPVLDDVPKFVVPVLVTASGTEFTLFAVWSKGRQRHPYVEAGVEAVKMYRTTFEAGPTVLMGDMNANTIWDKSHPKDRNHTALVTLLDGLGIASAYHAHHEEEQGVEATPTFYFRWQERSPFHIDYCFIPKAWLPHVGQVEVGTYAGWSSYSDHRPLVVDLSIH